MKKLKYEMGINSLDALINTMMRVTNEHRLVYKNTGWIGSPKEKLKKVMSRSTISRYLSRKSFHVPVRATI